MFNFLFPNLLKFDFSGIHFAVADRQSEERLTERTRVRAAFKKIPDEVLLSIFQFLSLSALAVPPSVSKKWNVLLKSSVLWKIVASSIGMETPVGSDVMGLVKNEILQYKNDSPLYKALAPIIPYHLYQQIPDVEGYIPERYRNSALGFFDPSMAFTALKYEIKCRFPIYKIGKNSIHFNFYDSSRDVKGRVSLQFVEESENFGNKKWMFTYRPNLISNIVHVWLRFESMPDKILDYINRLVNRIGVGHVTSSDESTFIETTPEKTATGSPVIELLPEKNMKELREKSKQLKIDYPIYYS